MVTMGIDASSTAVGYSVFNGTNLIDYGCFKPKGNDWRDRIQQFAPFIKSKVVEHQVDKVILEDVPLMGRQMKTLVILGAVQGMLIGIFGVLKVPIEFVLPSAWRSPIGLFDGTKKGTLRNEMKRKSVEKANKLFELELRYVSPNSTKNDDDISDAILVAYSQISKVHFAKDPIKE